ncbi:MAG: CehA/McbA family metallohydrolase [Planctomycetia bacterium]|nr:CehA/McbA family metallohydrolase [Planctomycetia bacterium]
MSGPFNVSVRVTDAGTNQPTPVRVRFTDAEENYIAPLGRLGSLTVKTDLATAEGNVLLANDRVAAYIDGACEVPLPTGPIQVEINKGPEYRPLRSTVELPPGKMALRFTLERWTDLRAEGWYAGDTRVHGLTPHAALLEGSAEGLAVVNLLAWRTNNLLAFSGQQPALAAPDCQVVVNTLNTHPVLGWLGLLNSHRIVFPLTFGEPDSADRWTLADWCNQCHRKGGLVVGCGLGLPGGPWPGGTLAELILGRVDALELPRLDEAILREVYPLLDCNLRTTLVAGSGKVDVHGIVGRPRTYAHLQPGQEFSYRHWIEAIRAGRTFVTSGPLLSFAVNGQEPGARLDLPGETQQVHVRAEVRSSAPFARLEVVINGVAVAAVEPGETSPYTAVLEGNLPITESGWLAARCLRTTDSVAEYAAHTSPVYVRVADRPHVADPIALAHLTDQLNRVQHWAEHGARYENDKQRAALLGIFQEASAALVSKCR